ncbi:meiotic chromosome segregation protein [Sugiyamaella lignohabitans]|uniref:Meiotic chromosome segregation protein n=1 Tax=Sugiyamaella lignohabitans TaxID=796027 RepID=A0A167DHQ0_9ASCO|nr:meiotic chromosome segregation protein [Sugiyamaella lignohabitans]ANB12933.1 meiotic chromosome segregation protein [Sugiyamaella lignohabitans]
MQDKPDQSDEIISEQHEFDVMWTSQMVQKRKKWYDGRLKFFTFNKRSILYDEFGHFVADYFLNRHVNEGDQLVFDSVLVSVEAKRELVIRNIAPALESLRKESRAKDRSKKDSANTDVSLNSRDSTTTRRSQLGLEASNSRTSRGPFGIFSGPPANIITNDTFRSAENSARPFVRPTTSLDIQNSNNLAPSPGTSSPPVAILTPLKPGPSLGLKRRRILNSPKGPSQPVVSNNSSNVRIRKLTVNYESGSNKNLAHSRVLVENRARDTVGGTTLEQRPERGHAQISTSVHEVVRESSPVLVREEVARAPQTGIDAVTTSTGKMLPLRRRLISIQQSSTTNDSNHQRIPVIKRNSRSLISLQRNHLPETSLAHESANGSKESNNSETTDYITPELQLQLSQDLDHIKEVAISPEDDLYSEDGLSIVEMHNMLNRAKSVATSTSHPLLGNTSESSSRSTTAVNTIDIEALESTGPWTKEALDLFSWRPPDLPKTCLQ